MPSKMHYSRVAVLVDAGFLSKVNMANGGTKLDFEKVFLKMRCEIPLLRNYYYDCKPYVGTTPTKEEREKQASYDKFTEYIQKIKQTECKFGRLQKIGEQYTQKGVDTLIAIDITTLATKRLVTHISLFTGDSDLIPAIQVAKNEGVIINLFTHRNNVNIELIKTCDIINYVDDAWFKECVRS